ESQLSGIDRKLKIRPGNVRFIEAQGARKRCELSREVGTHPLLDFELRFREGGIDGPGHRRMHGGATHKDHPRSVGLLLVGSILTYRGFRKPDPRSYQAPPSFATRACATSVSWIRT